MSESADSTQGPSAAHQALSAQELWADVLAVRQQGRTATAKVMVGE